jgi:hypothetical protein
MNVCDVGPDLCLVSGQSPEKIASWHYGAEDRPDVSYAPPHATLVRSDITPIPMPSRSVDALFMSGTALRCHEAAPEDEPYLLRQYSGTGVPIAGTASECHAVF